MYEAKDLTGIRFGRLTAIEPTDKREAHYVVWRCKCDCGNECYVNTKRLVRGTITNCGCIPKMNLKNGSKPADLTGQIFGNLTVLSRAENQNNRTAWHCRCTCGNIIDVTTHDLRTGHIKSCGCIVHQSPFYKDLSGQRFGMLTVLKKLDSRDYKGSVQWLCQCDCGNEYTYSEDALVHGGNVSCGCYRREVLSRQLNEHLHRVDGTCVEILMRQKPRSDNKSGHVGIHLTKDGRYRAMIGLQGKRYYLGTYQHLEDALKARRRGEEIHIAFLEQYFEEQRIGEMYEKNY